MKSLIADKIYVGDKPVDKICIQKDEVYSYDPDLHLSHSFIDFPTEGDTVEVKVFCPAEFTIS